MQIIEFLNTIDQKLFMALNSLHNPFMDGLMWQISGKFIWVPLYLVIIWFLIKKRAWNAVYTLIAIALMIVVSDQVSGLIKDSVMRFRPSHEPLLNGLVHLVKDSHGNLYKGGDYGFVSSHAANTFAVALFVTLFFRVKWATILIFVWAVVVSYSRIYLGVHYPFDILGGAIVGLASGLLLFHLEKYIVRKYPIKAKKAEVSG